MITILGVAMAFHPQLNFERLGNNLDETACAQAAKTLSGCEG